MPRIPLLNKTKGIFKARWSVAELKIPDWVVHAIIWITTIRSLSYGLELLFFVTNNPIGPMMAFAAVFGIQLWGILMIVSVLICAIGVLTRRSMVVTIGALLCAAVWTCFALVLGFGWFSVGTGVRFVIAAAATACTWGVFFRVQLSTYKKAVTLDE